jgi:hypothetical protein
MNIDNIYTFQFVRPSNKVQNEGPENEGPENEVPENEVPENEVPENEVPENEGPKTKVPTKTLVEGILTSVCKDPDNQGRSIFSNCTVYNYYSNLTMPVVNSSQIYSIPTSWISHWVEGGIEKWNQ